MIYIERTTGKKETEKVFGEGAIRFFYGKGKFLLPLIAKIPFISYLYCWWQKQNFTKKNIAPFVKKFDMDATEFKKPIEDFTSFNDFFIRKLKTGVRPLHKNPAIIPADGRYLFFQDVCDADNFFVKGKKFNLGQLLQNDTKGGSLVIGRLCPTDYHRFHFPCDCIPKKSRLINGYLYSVNPVALKTNAEIFSENKRRITELETLDFGKVLYIEVGATNVGSIIETYTPDKPYNKGEEKGYFSFGGSAVLLLFEPGRITFDADLIAATQQGFEMRCLLGQSLGITG